MEIIKTHDLYLAVLNGVVKCVDYIKEMIEVQKCTAGSDENKKFTIVFSHSLGVGYDCQRSQSPN